jgi:hypothetical protein
MKITSPDSTHQGVDHYGATALQFVDGVADFDGDLPPGVRQYLVGAGYTLADDDEPVQFDPADRTAADVVEYLGSVDDDEAARILSAEADGKARKTVLEWVRPSESQED